MPYYNIVSEKIKRLYGNFFKKMTGKSFSDFPAGPFRILLLYYSCSDRFLDMVTFSS